MLGSALPLSAFWIVVFCGTAAAGELVTVLVGPDHATPAVLDAMQQAADSALAPGVTLTWKTVDQMEGRATSAPLAIIRLRGQCRPEDAVRWLDPASPVDGRPLGQTYMANGKVLSVADVLCDNVAALVGPNLRSAPASERDGLLGRALGRVIAHELYHIVLRTTSHSQDGLSRSRQRSADLLALRNFFSDPDRRKLAQVESSTGPLGIRSDPGN